MVNFIQTTSTFFVNTNGLNPPIKRQINKVCQKHDPVISCVKETHFKYKDTSKYMDGEKYTVIILIKIK